MARTRVTPFLGSQKNASDCESSSSSVKKRKVAENPVTPAQSVSVGSTNKDNERHVPAVTPSPKSKRERRSVFEDSDFSSAQSGSSTHGSEKDEEIESVGPMAEDPLDDLIYKRVAVDFPQIDEIPFFGTVTRKMSDEYFEIKYDDGDREDLTKEDVTAGIMYCDSIVADTELTLWEIHHIASPKILNCLPVGFGDRTDSVIEFFLYVSERQKVWERRCEMGNALLWTNSPVLRNYFFCNNYRELDRATAFFHAHILDLWEALENGNLKKWIRLVLWASVCYRLVDRIKTFQEDGIPTIENWPHFKKRIQKIQNDPSRGKFFTGSRQPSNFASLIGALDSLYENDHQLLKSLAKEIKENTKKGCLKSCIKAIRSIKGCGEFLAWQIGCDMIESNALPFCNTDDFCVFGKGSKAGILKIFYGSQSSQSTKDQHGQKPVKYLRWAKKLVEIQDKVFEEINEQRVDGRTLSLPKWRGRRYSLKEIEHALCEYYKFNEIERACREGRRPTGQRLRSKNSQSCLDDSASCKCGEEDRVRFCDTCNKAWCDACVQNSSHPEQTKVTSWVCCRCIDLQDHQWE